MDPLGKIAAANAFKLSLQIMADYWLGSVDGELAGGCLAALMTFQKNVIGGKVEPDEGFVFHPRPTTQHFSLYLFPHSNDLWTTGQVQRLFERPHVVQKFIYY